MSPSAENGIVHLSSTHTVDEVLAHLLTLLQEKAITIFVVVDHSGEAAKAGFSMRNTKLVLFGSPKAGTPLMLVQPGLALDLPLKILIAEEPTGSTRVSYNSTAYLQARHDLPSQLAANISAIEQIATAITG